MIVTIGSTKGGVGKSTLAINAAIARTIAGRRVWLIDADRQGTSYLAMQARAQAGHLPLIDCDHLHEWERLEAEVSARAGDFDDVVIDAGGRDNAALRVAMLFSDRLVIPAAPRAFDVWALDDMLPLVDAVRQKNKRLEARVMLSCADTVGKDNKGAREALSAHPGIEYLDAPVARRKAIGMAVAQGLSVLEFKPKDQKAIAEIQAFTRAIFTPLQP